MATINPRVGPGEARPPREDEPPRRGGAVRVEHIGLAGVLALSSLLEFNKLRQNGYANLFYAAAVKSMLRSLHNFFFVSFDPGGLMAVDKPPLGLWLQALSAKLFGFAPLPLLVPEGICAVLAVALIYFIVAPRFGPRAGLLSALALAVFPSFVAVSRDNAIDPLLILLMLAACGAGIRAIESGRTRTLILSGVLIGLAFNTKSLAALLCVPGIGLGFLVCAPASMRRRMAQLAVAGAVMVAICISWSLAVDLTPASQRPYVGGSTNNSEFQLEFGYNGFGRVGGQNGGPTGTVVAPTGVTPLVRPGIPPTQGSIAAATALLAGRARPADVAAKPAAVAAKPADPQGRVRRTLPIPFGGSPSVIRIFELGFGDQGGWTVPFAVLGLLGIALLARRRRDRRAAVLFALGGWFVVELFTLDFSQGIVHPYYVSALGPGLAAMVGAGAAAIAWLARSAERRKAALGLAIAALATATTLFAELWLIHREGYPEAWRIPLVILAVVALAAVVLWRRRANWSVGALVLVLLVAPALYTKSVWDAPVDGTFPTAGPYNMAGWGGIDLPAGELKVNIALERYVRAHHPTKRFALLTEASDAASPLILLGLNAAAMGGYNTIDPALNGPGLARLVADDEARYVLLGGPYSNRGGNAASRAAQLVCPEVRQQLWNPGQPTVPSLYLVDCRGRARELREPSRAAAAYLRSVRRRERVM
ncbi:MAG: glycosyltransferase family 39 protein [Solirubrobacteraceae bacterium]|jgi:4-amino-4-deoxy-L-arabinose transferase-like glycosyltransferase